MLLSDRLQDLRALRGLRDRLTAEVATALRQVIPALGSSYLEQAVQRFFQQFLPLPARPDDLHLHAEGFHAALTDPRLELPASRPGVEVDIAEVARGFEEPMGELGETLAELLDKECEADSARSRRAAARERLRDFAVKVARFYEALAVLAGDERIAQRLRQRRRGKL